MEKSAPGKKPDPQLLKRLRSGEERLVLRALTELRSTGHTGYVPELLQVMNHSGENVRREMVRLLSDIKAKAVIPLLIEGLNDPELKAVHAGIASACWQSGMDYSTHIDVFIRIFLESDYMTALESFSVIEQSLAEMAEPDIRHTRNLILEGLEKISEDKSPLAGELLHLME